MGGLFTKHTWSDGIRHQSMKRHSMQYGVNSGEERRELANFQGYYACRGFGKCCGYRAWECTNQAVTFHEAMAWINAEARLGEAPVDSTPRIWESPYLYQIVQVRDRDELEYVLGEKPTFV